MSTAPSRTASSSWISPTDAHLDDLLEVLEQPTRLADYPHASTVEQQVLVYESATLRRVVSDPVGRRAVQAELAHALSQGPGIVVFSQAFDDRDVLDRTTAAFDRLIEMQRASGSTAGDHFAKPGANDRIWNALEKLAVTDPEAFVAYYANDLIALVSQAWLGPGYQVTSQLNVVNPGGAGQTVHRDYHLGFQSPDGCAAYPAHVHALTPALTLQGAVAHVDMPVETGPTLYLPHSQKYRHGYVAYQLPQFQEYFLGHHVQLPLSAGDAVFFNPALFHAAGSNHTSDVRRMANLLQVSSPFGRSMETVDRARTVLAIYPALLAALDSGLPPRGLDNVIAASAEGYAFPTNLDADQPIDGMSPPTQAETVAAAARSGMPVSELRARLTEADARRHSH